MRTIGKYYREKVLCLPKKQLKKVELPSSSNKSIIEKDLFGWKLYSGKNYITCCSEEEARFLKVFHDSGVNETYVPKDNEYLKSILPDLEKIKKRIDEIIEFHIDGILNRRLRERARHEIYMEITK